MTLPTIRTLKMIFVDLNGFVHVFLAQYGAVLWSLLGSKPPVEFGVSICCVLYNKQQKFIRQPTPNVRICHDEF